MHRHGGNVTTSDVSNFICAAYKLARKSGLHITTGDDFEEYVGITGKLPGKTPTDPNFRPDCSDLLPGKAFWIIGRDRQDRIAHVQAMRLYDLSNTSLDEHLETLRAFFADPHLKAGPGSSCTCYAPSARGITGRVAYRGDLWLREDFRGRGLLAFLGQIAFGLAWAKWAPDFICALVAGWNIEKGVADRNGYVHKEPHGAILRLPAQGIYEEDWLVWLTREDMLKILSRASE
ncbi:MAG: hypothetical protein EOQ86_14120 [Mesorhizobium sp.]|nr:MAG: hypothetical protein EOQ56_16690 [Mesorhizobium sp.]TGS61882.1 hypothetical protein EN844_28200 [Mesorhizobium sp. M3A.F.Ca.ET.201.01.1.1]RWG59015.1 MAG: hypothetical protein EOQ64_06100 [Mesorhizobium sp.]RWH47351.1 MAG: hypothetical protein EOQ78_00160 [Mesorhizobium sp.]RWH79766.1 MAG: hypothetical protein EOQ85_12090 [Mesorhizobium sp.]